jgi:hypothetical protein
MTIGGVVAIVGAYTRHPVFGFPTPSYLRGAVFGAIISIQLAVGVFMSPATGYYSQMTLFWLTILAGAIYGSIIDMIATRVGGEGRDLLWKK